MANQVPTPAEVMTLPEEETISALMPAGGGVGATVGVAVGALDVGVAVAAGVDGTTVILRK